MSELDQSSGIDGASDVEHTPIPEQIRDDAGRFASREKPQPEPVADQRPQPQGDGQEQAEGEQPERQGMVPHQALHAAREEAKQLREQTRAFEAQLAEIRAQNQFLMQQYGQRAAPQQEPQAPPDWYQDPDAAFKYYSGQEVTPLRQEIAQTREQFSQMMAADKFGIETVSAAEAELRQYAQQNPQQARFDWQRIMASPHPYGELVNWYKQRSTLNRVGSDPDAFIEAEIERRLAERAQGAAPQPQAATPQAARNPQVMPSSFANARNAGPRSSAQATGARSLSDIMGR